MIKSAKCTKDYYEREAVFVNAIMSKGSKKMFYAGMDLIPILRRFELFQKCIKGHCKELSDGKLSLRVFCSVAYPTIKDFYKTIDELDNFLNDNIDVYNVIQEIGGISYLLPDYLFLI